jgi:hypothetical protein
MRGERLIAARIVAGLAAVFWGWLFFGVQDTLTVFAEGQDFAAHYLMESGWGLMFLVLVAVPLMGLAWRPWSPLLVAEVAAVGVAVCGGGLLAHSWAHLLPAAGLLLTALVVGALGRRDMLLEGRRLDRPLAILAATAAVPALAYAWRMATGPHDLERTVNLDHYPIQAALGIAVFLLAGLIACTRQWPGGWLATATLVVVVAWMGIESAVYPHLLGSFGPIWSWLAIGWAMSFGLVARIGDRRDTPTLPTPTAPRDH